MQSLIVKSPISTTRAQDPLQARLAILNNNFTHPCYAMPKNDREQLWHPNHYAQGSAKNTICISNYCQGSIWTKNLASVLLEEDWFWKADLYTLEFPCFLPVQHLCLPEDFTSVPSSPLIFGSCYKPWRKTMATHGVLLQSCLQHL